MLLWKNYYNNYEELLQSIWQWWIMMLELKSSVLDILRFGWGVLLTWSGNTTEQRVLYVNASKMAIKISGNLFHSKTPRLFIIAFTVIFPHTCLCDLEAMKHSRVCNGHFRSCCTNKFLSLMFLQIGDIYKIPAY